jgi:polyhydroxyalkanoate synthesis regulator phasin
MDERREEEHRRPTISEGIRSGIGVLAAFKEAIEETIQEASARGDLSPERAKEFLGSALHRAQDAVGDVRERLDLVPRREFEALQQEVAGLRRRLDALEGRSAPALPPPPEGPTGPTEARMP